MSIDETNVADQRALPAALAGLGDFRQFVIWRYEPQRIVNDGRTFPAGELRKAGYSDPQVEALPISDAKAVKAPINPHTLNHGSAHDPANWLAAAEAFAREAELNRDNGDGSQPYGVGFVLTQADPFVCVDLDGVIIDGRKLPIVDDVLAYFPGAAVELSNSGRGLHVWFRHSGKLPAHKSKNTALGLELYETARYIALGKHDEHAPTGDANTDCTATLGDVIARWFAPGDDTGGDSAQWTNAPHVEWNGYKQDANLLRAANRSKRGAGIFNDDGGATFTELWNVEVDALAKAYPAKDSGRDYDASGADQALANRLAFYTGGNCERIERLMLASGLRREKWERESYLRATILKAVAGCTKYHDRDYGKNAADTQAAVQAAVQDGSGTASIVEAIAGVATGDYRNPYPWKDHNACNLALQKTAIVVRSNTRRRAQVEINENVQGWKRLTDGRLLNLRDRIANGFWYATAKRDASPLNFGKDQFMEYLTALGYVTRVDPFRDWLENLPGWDLCPRVDGWLNQLFVLADGLTDLNQWAARFVFLGAIQRTMEPGCKLDEMPVLLGPQNTGKSTALRAMLPEDKQAGLIGLFSDGLHLAADSKTRAEALQGRVIVEASEMSGSTRAELESLKAFLTRTDDGDHRKAYGRNPEPSPRMSIIVGTSNDMHVLPNDTSGNRRFVVVRLTASRMAAESFMATYAVQLWAEAMARYASGERANLPRELGTVQSEVNAEYRRADYLEDLIAQRTDLHGRTLAEISRLVGFGGASMKTSEQGRLASAMRQNGYEADREYQNGRQVRIWKIS